jgi:hypothetical protein
MENKQALGARADSFTTHHQRLAHDASAAVAALSLERPEDKPVVAAVKPSSGKGVARGHGGSQFRSSSHGNRGWQEGDTDPDPLRAG